MRVAVIHFHLRRGGVTRVIETAADSLRGQGVDLLVLGGEAPATNGLPDDQVEIISALGYRDGFDLAVARQLKTDLESAARVRWGALPDIWHVHNHSLAKNLEVPWVIARWAEEGRRLLLQPHDFSEDGRPVNYQKLVGCAAVAERLYPVGSTVLYGLLNSRDRGLLKGAGMPESQTVPLPNAVREFATDAEPIDLSQFGAERLILYPSRSIRRKNLGEILLHAAVTETGTRFGCTLAPDNPTALPIYDRWTAFAREKGLPVEFNLGPRTGASLESMMAAASALITTSVAEGFGLAFLEPWLAGRRLVGRNLADITADFTDEGVDLSGLYDELPIPIKWVGESDYQATLRREITSCFGAYGRAVPDDAVAALCARKEIDFGQLSEPMQERVIGLVLDDSAARDHLRALDSLGGDDGLVARNREAVAAGFGVPEYGKRLKTYYDQLMSADGAQCDWLDPGKLLDEFLSPERFCLLRT